MRRWCTVVCCILSFNLFSAALAAADTYYLARVTQSCQQAKLISTINNQPFSPFQRLLLSAGDLRAFESAGCEFELKTVSSSLSQFIQSHSLYTYFNTWGTLGKDERQRVLDTLSRLQPPGELPEEERKVIHFWRLGSQYQHYDLNGVLSTAKILQAQALSAEQAFVVSLLEAETHLRMDNAEQALRELDTVRTTKDTHQIAQSLRMRRHYLLAEILLAHNRLQDAHTALLSAEQIGEAKGYIDHRDRVTLKDNWGYYFVRRAMQSADVVRDDIWLALDAEMAALQLAKEYNSHRQLILLHSNIAWMHKVLGRLSSAKKHFLIALHLLQSSNDTERAALVSGNLATIYQELGDAQRALYYLTHSAKLSQHDGSAWSAKLLCKLADLAWLSDNTALARQYLADCQLQAAKLEDNHELTLRITNLQARLNNTAPVTPALWQEQIQQADAMSEKGNGLLLMAKYAEASQRPELVRQALEAYKQTSNKLLLFDAYAESLTLGVDDGTLSARAKALSIDVLSDIGADEVGAFWIGKVHDFWMSSVAQLMSQGETRLALRTLLQLQRLRHDARQRVSGARETSIQRSNNLAAYSQLSALSLITPQAQSPTATFHKAVMQDLDWLYTSAYSQDFTQAELEGYQRLRLGLPTAAFASSDDKYTLDALPQGHLMLVYSLNQHVSGVFVVKGKRVEFAPLNDLSELNTTIRKANAALSNRDPNAMRLAVAVKEMLLPPDIAAQDWSHVNIVADGALHYYPESLLFSPSTKVVRSYLPDSATKPTQQAASVMLMGITSSLSELTGLSFDDASYNTEIPMTAREISQLRNLGAGDYQLFTDEQVTKSQLLSPAARHSDVLHLSLHHYFDPQRASDVGLFLSPTDPANPLASGFLTLSELSRSDFNNQLVFLNGCETFKGEYVRGNGVLGVANGFLQAGAGNVVSTLWKVGDRASMEFTKHFYSAYFEHADAAASLAYARQQMARSIRFRHPYYWAGYALLTN